MMPKRNYVCPVLCFAWLVIFLFPGSRVLGQRAAGSVTPLAASSPPPQIKYEKYKLKNGLDVILYEDHRLPLVAVNIWYHVGPASPSSSVRGQTGS